MQSIEYFARTELNIQGKTIAAGEKLATLEIPDGIPVDRVVNAIVRTLATTDKPATADKPAEQANQPLAGH